MYADVSPTQIELGPKSSATFLVRISNGTNSIDAYDINLFGLDPTWVQVEPRRLSLFPSETESVAVTVTLPADFPSGIRLLSLHVRSANDPTDFSLVPATMLVTEQPRLSLRMDPVIVNGGSRATFGLVIANDGNNTVRATADGVDPEAKSVIEFDPPEIELAPGGREVIQARVTSPRPWMGAPKVRTFTFGVEAHTRSEAIASFVQKPRFGRLLFVLLGLATAVFVFAFVLGKTFDKVVTETKTDQASLAAALDQGGTDPGGLTPVNPGILTGNVTLSTTDAGIAGVRADLFDAGNTNVAVATAATDDTGTFAFPRLRAGSYKLRLQGAGFADVWYPAATNPGDAKKIPVILGANPPLAPVQLGGLPGSVKGSVKVADPTGAIAELVVTGVVNNAKPVVSTVAVSADGTFFFETVPSPATYLLQVTKAGYAPTSRSVVVGPAEPVDGIEVVLRRGDGVISGTLRADGAGLGGATVVATDGTTEISTVTLTEGAVGFFRLRALPTPAVYTITFDREGFTSETRTISLTTGGEISGTDVQLQRANGSISGLTTLRAPDGTSAGALGGVTVTIASGDTKVVTTTVSLGAVGTYFVAALPQPATYTVTFSKPGFVEQVRLVDLDPLSGLPDASADRTDVDVELLRSSATVGGIVRATGRAPVAGATVVLSDGTTTRTLSTANDPLGRFAFDNVAPGAYTLTATLPGTSQSVLLVNVVNASDQDLDIALDAQASLVGRATLLNTTTGGFDPLAGATVRLFLPATFPGSTLNAVASVVTDANGAFAFLALDAPQDYVVAVYATPTSPDPVDSRLLLTQPSTQITVPTFQLAALF